MNRGGLREFVRRHAFGSYACLTLMLSWGSLLPIVGISDWPGPADQVDQLFPIALVAMLLGPLVAGLSLTAVVHGFSGFRSIWDRLTKGRVSPVWYAIALLGVPAICSALLFPLALHSGEFLPGVIGAEDRSMLLVSGLGAGLMGGLLEEPGWTGFALPELRRRHGLLGSGLMLGFLWGLWHIPITAWASGGADGSLSWALFGPPLVFYLAVLPVFRVLMVWLHERTKSLLLVMLTHGSLTASTLFIFAPSVQGGELIAYYSALAVVFAALSAWVLGSFPPDSGPDLH